VDVEGELDIDVQLPETCTPFGGEFCLVMRGFNSIRIGAAMKTTAWSDGMEETRDVSRIALTAAG
jgi:hypothetical protein